MIWRRARLASVILVLLGARAVDAQRVMGRIIECRDRPQILLKAGYVAAVNDAQRPGVTGRAMATVHCDPRGREGVELGFVHVPFHETRYPRNSAPYQQTAHGNGRSATYGGLVTERSLPGLPNLHGVVGVGFYSGTERTVNESVFVNGPNTQTSRYDYTNRHSGVGASVGAAFLLNATSSGAVHLDARQHFSASGVFFTVSGGILF